MNNEEIIKNAYRINRIYSTFVMIKVFIMFLLFFLATYLPAFFYFHKDPLFWWNCNEIWMIFINIGFVLYFYLDFCEYINIFIRSRRIIKRFCKDEASAKIVEKVINKPLLLTEKRVFNDGFFKPISRINEYFAQYFFLHFLFLHLFTFV
ncbi:hypothetical protein MYMA111404_00415 [Mycoplasma marinum]